MFCILSLKSSESSKEHLKLFKQISSEQSGKHFVKFGQAPGTPHSHHNQPESHRGHHTHHPHNQYGSSPRPTPTPENTISLSSQVPLPPSSASPTVIHTTTTAAAIMATSTVSAIKITDGGSSIMAPSALLPKGITDAMVLALPLPRWLSLLLPWWQALPLLRQIAPRLLTRINSFSNATTDEDSLRQRQTKVNNIFQNIF